MSVGLEWPLKVGVVLSHLCYNHLAATVMEDIVRAVYSQWPCSVSLLVNYRNYRVTNVTDKVRLVSLFAQGCHKANCAAPVQCGFKYACGT